MSLLPRRCNAAARPTMPPGPLFDCARLVSYDDHKLPFGLPCKINKEPIDAVGSVQWSGLRALQGRFANSCPLCGWLMVSRRCCSGPRPATGFTAFGCWHSGSGLGPLFSCFTFSTDRSLCLLTMSDLHRQISRRLKCRIKGKGTAQTDVRAGYSVDDRQGQGC